MASSVFKDPNAITIFDDDHSEKEDRWLTMGISSKGSILIVCHTFMQINKDIVIIRIISSRKATKKEIIQYEGDLI